MENSQPVRVWGETIKIPTYGTGTPEKNPIFLENRVYQGSSGVVYPHPVIEKILDKKEDKDYFALFLENRYLKIMILPQIGGRIHMAYDKVKQRHFVYYNQVIKPALVGLTGPWISGGIEFNWPQHHRPSTFDPIDFTIEEHEDGSKTVWVSEVERMFRTKGMAGFRLYPEKAYIEINAKLFNRTPFPQTFLWWANPAVKVNDHYQSIFPPDVHAVFDHGKRDVSEFPIARGTYYKVDYSAGVDISRYKNIPVPTSYMAIKSEYDFMGGYEHDTRGGLLHVANHHVSPGKKQWTWGNGEFGYAWDRNLTDEDGPYIELMTGVFTDNQPDFSWIQPNEERTFTQYFMPYSELGVVKNATKDAAVNVEVDNENITIKFYTTAEHKKVLATLLLDNQTVWSEHFTISPEKPFCKTVNAQATNGKITAALVDEEGRELVSYLRDETLEKEIPSPAQAAKLPPEIASIEELYLTGLHIEQYRHATYKSTDYYEEALRREPHDIRNNNAMGLWYLRRGKFAKAESYFQTAVHTLTKRNPNPYDGEPFFNLGLSLFMQDKFDDAYNAFYKSAWNSAWQDAAYLFLARIEVRKNNFTEALRLIDYSLNRNYSSQTARHLKVIILRKLHRFEEASSLIQDSLKLDRFSIGCIFEKLLINRKLDDASALINSSGQLEEITRGNIHTYIEYAFDYAHAGLYSEASELIELSIKHSNASYPMLYYYLADFAGKLSDFSSAKEFAKKASLQSPDYCFPNRIEDVAVLNFAQQHCPEDSMAAYYLGNFWYANRQYADAIECWEKSRLLNPGFPTVHRNLALAYHNKLNNAEASEKSLATAFNLNPNDARVLMELDQLHKKMNYPHRKRLDVLEKSLTLVEDRDDLYLERIALYNHLGEFKIAKGLLSSRQFHPWEGGEGKVVGQYQISHIELAKLALEQSKYEDALRMLESAENYPFNLGEGKLYGAQENDIHYLKGCAYEGLSDQTNAKMYFQKATEGLSEPVQAIYYNDQNPDKILYQGLAWKKLGNFDRANQIFTKLIDFGTQHLNDKIKIDYFAVSLPDLLVFDQDLDQKNRNHCYYLIGLGYLGLGNGNLERAEEFFDKVLEKDINHFGAFLHKRMIRHSLLVE